MPRIPGSIQNSAYGTENPNLSITLRKVVEPAVTVRAPAQGKEQFSANEGMEPDVARGLQQLQSNIDAATAQTKGSPTANKNVLQGVVLANGGANGASPNVLKHGLGRKAVGYSILNVSGGYVTAHALVANPNSAEDDGYVRIWTTRTLFAGATAVVAQIEVF